MSDQQATTASTSSLSPTHGVLLVIGSAAAALVVLGVLFRPRKKSS